MKTDALSYLYIIENNRQTNNKNKNKIARTSVAININLYYDSCVMTLWNKGNSAR